MLIKQGIKTYTAHVNPNKPDPLDNAELIEEKFNFWLLLTPINIFWAIANRCWLLLGLIICTELTTFYLLDSGILDKLSAGWIKLVIFGYLALNGNDFKRNALQKRGFITTDIITATNIADANHRFYNNYINKANAQNSNN